MKRIEVFFLVLLLILLTSCSMAGTNESTVVEVENTPPAPMPAPTLEIAATSMPPPPTPVVTNTAANPPASATASPELAPTAAPAETPVPSSPVDSIELAPILIGEFVKPLYLTHALDDRLFVVEEAGTIRIVRNGSLLETPFLDIRDRVDSAARERGLLGLAFHPNYAQNGLFYVNYTDGQGNTQISRFVVDASNPDRADPSSETILLSIEQPYGNHNGGQIAFGPDGYLYVGVGDGGSANDPFLNGQDRSTLLGSLLRLDASSDDRQAISPSTNPFVADPAARDEIWAWGLRNPWRFSFDRATGDLFIADVGQNSWEEVNFQSAQSTGGENYGWNILEASSCFMSNGCDMAGLELPIFEYDHRQGCSISGGYMYRGSQNPALYGNYFVGDYCQGTIWRLFHQQSGEWSSALVLDSDVVISSFGEDAAGELYVLDHMTGSLYQIRQTP